jgi:tetratricopeptide (TPR) repeat protein
MIFCRRLTTALAFAAVWFFAGCGRGDAPLQLAEPEEPFYQQGMVLKRQGRNAEALLSFLKVIEKRGQSAPESHLEAGLIFLTHSKDFIEAIHHFEAYLSLQPNSGEARRVRELVNTAKREFARTLPARPAEDHVYREAAAELDQLRRENEELRAQIATLRGGGAAPVPRSGRGVSLSIPDPARAPAPAPLSARPVVNDSPIAIMPPTAASPITAPAPTRAKAAATPAPAGRSYRVKRGDSLFSIARQFDAVNTSRKVREIAEANPEVFVNGNINAPLRPDTPLRIP